MESWEYRTSVQIQRGEVVGGQLELVPTCDHCKRQILNVTDVWMLTMAMYEDWPVDRGTLWILHRACAEAFLNAHSTVEERADFVNPFVELRGSYGTDPLTSGDHSTLARFALTILRRAMLGREPTMPKLSIWQVLDDEIGKQLKVPAQ